MSQLVDWLLGRPDAFGTASWGVQALHVLTGLLLVYFHGLHKLEDGLAWRSGRRSDWPFAEEVAAAGFPFPTLSAWAATAAQLVGGACLAVGLFTRPAAIVLFATLLGAAYTNVVLKKTNQMALLYLILIACVAAIGPGNWSLDAWLFR